MLPVMRSRPSGYPVGSYAYCTSCKATTSRCAIWCVYTSPLLDDYTAHWSALVTCLFVRSPSCVQYVCMADTRSATETSIYGDPWSSYPPASQLWTRSPPRSRRSLRTLHHLISHSLGPAVAVRHVPARYSPTVVLKKAPVHGQMTA